jgi:hypothetical protein
MTRAEKNIVLKILAAKMRVYQQEIELNAIDDEENEEEYVHCLSILKKLQYQAQLWKREFFDGYITAKDIFSDYDALNADIDDLADRMGYPLDKGEGVGHFFGDMIWDAKCKGELD